RAALYGLRKLGAWVRGERAEILRRRDAVRAAFQRLSGWELLGSGAYFAFVRHPFEQASDEIARRLLAEQAILALPGTMFGPVRGVGGDGSAEACLRIAFANADEAGLETLGNRLSAFG
ncbi:MAG: aminotransferase class I/II-fold pyridoxal phosphate-dependent enzyme, partial [Rubricella sp.]